LQILFVHPNFPAQFGPLLRWLAPREDVDCLFVSRTATGAVEGVRRVPFTPKGGATAASHYCSRTFENAIWNAHAVYEACKADPGLRPDLVVGHSGFGTTLFLQELWDCPVLGYFEYYYHPHGTDLDYRPDFPPTELDLLRARARNAMILLDLETCAAGVTPTAWQHRLLPEAYRPKVEVIHDGVDRELWRRVEGSRRIGDEDIQPDTRIVTYVARGLESMRGFDVFVRVAGRIAAERRDVLFVVVGEDRVVYGGDLRHIEGESFLRHVRRTEWPDEERFRLLGRVAPAELVRILSLSDLHVHLSVPFVLSWSLLDALACRCTVLASDTEPIREVIEHEQTGLLASFFDEDALAAKALSVLENPAAYRSLGRAGEALVDARYALERTAPRHWELMRRLVER
jgi:glycosyltransferase involved in cell wall biosynthesis